MFSTSFILALVAAVSVTEELGSCICTLEIRPVCSTTGVEYSNRCQFECAKRENPSLELLSEEPCSHGVVSNEKVAEEKPCFCTMEYAPLCGSDGVVYSNPCLIACAQRKNPTLTVSHAGTCDSLAAKIVVDPVVQTKPCICTREFNPQCASNGITYGNICEFECARKAKTDLRIEHQGSCAA